MKNKLLKASTKLILLMSWLAATLTAHAQAPNWQLASASVGATATSTSTVYGMASDAVGNVYVTGTFSGTVAFNATTLTSPGTSSLFVAKWSRLTGAFLWAVRAGGAFNCTGRAIAVSGSSVYVAGIFTGTDVVFGTTTLLNRGSDTTDGFVAKLTDLGTSATFASGWVQQIGGVGDETVRALTLDGSNVYVAGQFSSQVVRLGSTNLANAGNVDGFVAKLTDAGTTSSFGWAVGVGGSGNEAILSMQVSGGSLYLGGEFSNTISLGSTTLVSAGNIDGFVAKIPDLGATPSFSWGWKVGGAGLEELFQLAVEGSNVYVCGVFGSTKLTVGGTTLTNAGIYDALVVKLIDAGTTNSVAWVQQIGGRDIDEAYGLAARGGKVYVGGGFGFSSAGNLVTTAAFGPTTLTTAGGGDVFLSRLTDAGTAASFDWTQTAGSSSNEELRALAVSGGNVYAAGFFSGKSLAFGTTTLLNHNGDSVGSLAGFVATAADPVLADDPVLPTRGPGTLAGVALYPNPTHATATVRVPASAGLATLTLLDALGQVVRTQTAAAGTDYPLYIAGLLPGVYTLRVQLAEGQAVCKLLVE